MTMIKYLLIILLLAGAVFGEGDVTAFGQTDLDGFGSATAVGDARANIHADYLHTAGSADTVKWIHYYFKSGDGLGDNDSLSFAIYTFSGGVPVTRVFITDPILFPSATASWDSVSVNSGDGFVLTEDSVYCLAYGDESVAGDVDRFYKNVTGGGDEAQTSALAGTWSSDGGVNYIAAMYADIDTMVEEESTPQIIMIN